MNKITCNNEECTRNFFQCDHNICHLEKRNANSGRFDVLKYVVSYKEVSYTKTYLEKCIYEELQVRKI